MSTPVMETAAPSQASLQPPPPPAPLASRIVDTFFSPTRVFEQFRGDAAPWLGPVLVSVAAALLLMAVRPLFISNRRVAELMLQKAAEMGRQNLPPADQMEGGIWLQLGFGAIATVFWLFVRPFVAGTVLALIFGALQGGRAGFRSYLAVASHALLVSTLGFVVAGVLGFATGRLDLSLDASLLLGPDAKGVLASVLGAITPFSLWVTALLALGGATVNRKPGWLGAASILLALQLALATIGGLVMQMVAAKAASGQ